MQTINQSSLPEITTLIAAAAATSDNAASIYAYHKIGTLLIATSLQTNPPFSFFKIAAHTIQAQYPQHQISANTLRSIYKFAKEYSEADITEKKLDQIPWGHHVTLLNSVTDAEARAFYLQSILKHRWSRAQLMRHLQTNLYERHARVVTNFSSTLPRTYAQQAHLAFKQSYLFSVAQEVTTERDIEEALMARISDFMKELGPGFSFIGRQYHIHTTGDDCYIDMLIYHIALRCYVVIELKNGPFKPEYAGKMHFYMQAVDAALKAAHDNATIGLILCRSSSPGMLATLYDTGKPMVIAEYQLKSAAPQPAKRTIVSSYKWYIILCILSLCILSVGTALYIIYKIN